MKNRAKTISLLLAVCMMITMLPAVAMAKGMENVRRNSVQYYSNGWLQQVNITFDVSNSGQAETNFGIHKNHEFKESTDTDPTYGDYTNLGDYADNNNYTDWTPAGPPNCGFIGWDSDTAQYMRPSDSQDNTLTINFAENPTFSNTEAATYYVYAWTKYSGEIYPDVMVCSFSVSNGEVIWSYPVSFDSNGGGGTMNSQRLVPGEAQNLIANTFTRDGYTFTGWNTEADGTGVSYGDGAAFKLDANATSGVTLYAQWGTGGNTGNNNTGSTPGTTAPARSSIDLWYNGGNSFGSSKSAVPTAVEIDGVAVGFTGNGREFSVGCVPADAKWVTVRWNSTSVTTNFTPDAAASCIEIDIPKTGDMPIRAAIAEFLGF